MKDEIFDLLKEVKKDDRRSLAKLITFLENTNTDQKTKDLVVDELYKNQTANSIRIAISGPPGVGKSTLIQQLGLYFVNKKHKVAVLAIDPSSPTIGGSLLGDKTRMEGLATHKNAFIRPSPSKGALGGVHIATKAAILACEYACFDIILIETVGVGQSEIDAANLSDFFILLHQPHAGDELQGIKKGINELADIIAVNKADQELKTAALSAENEIKSSLHLGSVDKSTKTTSISSLSLAGIKPLTDILEELILDKQKIQKKRSNQIKFWLDQELKNRFLKMLETDHDYKNELTSLCEKVLNKSLSPNSAINCLLEKYIS